MFNNFKHLLVGILAAVIMIAVGASAYNAYASGGVTFPSFSLQQPTQPLYGQVQGGGNGNGNGGQGQNGAGQGQGNQGRGGGVGMANISSVATIHGVVNSFDGFGFSITTDDGQVLYVQTGNMNYTQSIGFAPQAGTGVTVNGFTGDEGLFNAISVIVDGTGQVFTFRESTGRPAWAGGKGKGGNH